MCILPLWFRARAQTIRAGKDNSFPTRVHLTRLKFVASLFLVQPSWPTGTGFDLEFAY
jgi:hypothetical protein